MAGVSSCYTGMREAFPAVKTGAGALSHCVEAFDRRLSVQVYKDTAAKIVGCRSYRNVIFGDVDA